LIIKTKTASPDAGIVGALRHFSWRKRLPAAGKTFIKKPKRFAPKKLVYLFFLNLMKYFCFFFVGFYSAVFSQDFENTSSLDFSVYRGNVMQHTNDVAHLVTGHPDGFLVEFSKQTHGAKEWHKAYNFPDFGGYLMYQDFKNEFLGTNLSLGAHYNFYLLNRNLQLKLAQGLTYNNNPYDKVTNSKNKAFGSTLDANFNIGIAFVKPEIYKNIGLEAGFLFTHSSNGRFKSPNSGINSYSLRLGLQYDFSKSKTALPFLKDTVNYKEPIRYNFTLRSGVNESPVIGSGQFPFYHFGFNLDKRLGRKSAIQLGTELFLTTSFIDFIKYKSVAFPEQNIDANTDYKRASVFIGHELFINKISIETQVGYYFYRPYSEDISIYDRLGMKYYFTKKLFANFALKTHLFTAEAFEFGVGIRL
jgi:Lipid A 3-O-deacylase (PagL)